MALQIRKATLDDYEQLCDVFSELDEMHAEALPSIFRVPVSPLRSLDYMSGVISDGNASVLVAEMDGMVVGVIHVIVRDTTNIAIYEPRLYGWVDSLGVRKEYRREGVGQALMESAEQWVREKGATQFELNVWEFNQSAIRFYENLGFETASRRVWKQLDSAPERTEPEPKEFAKKVE